MTTKIEPQRRTAQEGGAGHGRPCRPHDLRAHLRRALGRRGAAAAASALALAGAGAAAPAALADESSGGETPAVETACRTAAAKSQETAAGLFPLREHIRGQSHTARHRRHKRRARGHARHAGRQASVTVPGWQTVITDSIGSYTEALLVNGETQGNCLVGPNPSEPPNVSEAYPGAQTITVGANEVGGFALGFYRTADGKPFSYFEGRAGSAVSGVSVTLKDDAHVSAKVLNGWFMGFWEGGGRVVTIEVVSSAGTSTMQFHGPANGQ